MRRFELRASRLYFALNLLVHGLAFVVVAFASISLWLKWIALAFCLLSYIVAERARTKNLRYQSLLFNGELFSLVDQAGKDVEIVLRSGVWSTPWMIALPYCLMRPSERKGVQLIFRDCLADEDWRQLRVILRTQIQALDQA